MALGYTEESVTDEIRHSQETQSRTCSEQSQTMFFLSVDTRTGGLTIGATIRTFQLDFLKQLHKERHKVYDEKIRGRGRKDNHGAEKELQSRL